jgi:hypothetical protein|tara:strand:- start:9200 stop:10075 length:876 start_codon:yes stop_codon:yes gene_type:complete
MSGLAYRFTEGDIIAVADEETEEVVEEESNAEETKHFILLKASDCGASGGVGGGFSQGNTCASGSGGTEPIKRDVVSDNDYGARLNPDTYVFEADEDKMQAHIAEDKPEMSDSEYESIVQYQAEGFYEQFNEKLRAEGYEADLNELESRVRQDLDNVLSRSRLSADRTLWRGVQDDSKRWDKLTVGSYVSNEGYMSTSLNPLFAHGFAMGKESALGFADTKDGVMFKIKAPKGSIAAGIEDRYYESDATAIESGGASTMSEYVLPREARLRVTGKFIDPDFGKVVELEYEN